MANKGFEYFEAVIDRILASDLFPAAFRSTIDLLIGEGQLGSVVTFIRMVNQDELLNNSLDRVYSATSTYINNSFKGGC